MEQYRLSHPIVAARQVEGRRVSTDVIPAGAVIGLADQATGLGVVSAAWEGSRVMVFRSDVLKHAAQVQSGNQ